MNDYRAGYYAVIPATVRYDKELSPSAKLLYGEISALATVAGYCWAKNEYFVELYGVSPRSITRWITQLVEKGYVYRELILEEKTQNILQRRLYINDIPSSIKQKETTPPDTQCQEGMTETSGGYRQNCQEGTDKIVQYNNTSINNTSINNIDSDTRMYPPDTEKKKTEQEQLIDDYSNNDKLRTALKDYLLMRKENKYKTTLRALKILFGELDKYGSSDDEKIEMLEEAILCNWKSVWPDRKKAERGNLNGFRSSKENPKGKSKDYSYLETKL